MNNHEAIEQLKFDKELAKRDYISPTNHKEYDLAISALEKQMPKKVHHFLDNDTFITTCCNYDITNESYDYCPNCGQLLGDVEEVEG